MKAAPRMEGSGTSSSAPGHRRSRQRRSRTMRCLTSILCSGSRSGTPADRGRRHRHPRRPGATRGGARPLGLPSALKAAPRMEGSGTSSSAPGHWRSRQRRSRTMRSPTLGLAVGPEDGAVPRMEGSGTSSSAPGHRRSRQRRSRTMRCLTSILRRDRGTPASGSLEKVSPTTATGARFRPCRIRASRRTLASTQAARRRSPTAAPADSPPRPAAGTSPR